VNFLDMGFQEVLLILAVALIIFGPGKLPEIGRTLGKTVRALRKATSTLTAEFTRELNEEEHSTKEGEKSDKGDKPAKS